MSKYQTIIVRDKDRWSIYRIDAGRELPSVFKIPDCWEPVAVCHSEGEALMRAALIPKEND